MEIFYSYAIFLQGCGLGRGEEGGVGGRGREKGEEVFSPPVLAATSCVPLGPRKKPFSSFVFFFEVVGPRLDSRFCSRWFRSV